LIEQSIGRGVRLPYGRRTGVTAVDRLNIVARDKFQEIIDEANRPGSVIQLQKVELDPDQLEHRIVTVVSQSHLATKLGLQPEQVTSSTTLASNNEPPLFAKPEEQKVAQIAYQVIRRLENQPEKVPTIAYLQDPAIQAAIVKEVEERYRPGQLELEGVTEKPDISAVVAKTSNFVSQQTIAIPRILVVPKGDVKSGVKTFTLELGALNLHPPSDELWVQHLRTRQLEIIGLFKGGIEEERLEDYVVSGLVDFDDICYDNHADLLYDLAGQTVHHFLSYLSEEDTRKVLRFHQRRIADFVHAQMQNHHWEDEGVEYEVKINKGFTELKRRSYTQAAGEPRLDFHQPPPDLSHIERYLFTGFSRCLYTEEKFQSDTERRFAVILDRDSIRWIYMLETKASNQLTNPIVLAKQEVAMLWCERTTKHNLINGAKPWRYNLIPHDAIAENMTLAGLVGEFE
jgi:type III restriction enzyme